ncbi:hypothetical protein HOG21_04015 [bacterium]|jgi:hypothetical protein|nr:hypothetical protein [bacterium]
MEIIKVDFKDFSQKMLPPAEILEGKCIERLELIFKRWFIDNGIEINNGILTISGYKVILSVFLISNKQIITLDNKALIGKLFWNTSNENFYNIIPEKCNEKEIKKASILEYCSFYKDDIREIKYALELDSDLFLQPCSVLKLVDLPSDIQWHLSNFCNK